MEDNIREKIINKAKEYLGTPWKHNHCCKGFGIDCVNLLSVCAQEVGFNIEMPKAYDRKPKYSSLHRTIEKHFIKTDIILKGDILLFSVGNDNNHVGLGIDGNAFIHSCYRNSYRGKVQIDKLSHSFWGNRLVRAYDLMSYRER